MVDFGTLSYGFASVAFLVLTGLLTMGWGGTSHGASLIAAAAITCAWGFGLAGVAAASSVSLHSFPVLEALRYGVWAYVLTESSPAAGLSRALVSGVRAAAVSLVIVMGTWVVTSAALGLTPLIEARDGLVASAVCAVLLLVLLSAIYWRTPDKCGLNHLALALAFAFGYDLFATLHALRVDAATASVPWLGRGFATAVTLPLVAIAAKRHPDWQFRIFISRQAALVVALVLLVAVTLVAALADVALLRAGGRTGFAVAASALVLATGGFLGLLAASERARQQLRVFIARHFYQYKYDYRTEWLRFVQTLSLEGFRHVGPDEARLVEDGVAADPYTRAVRAIAQIVGSPAGVLFLGRGGEEGTFDAVAAWPGEAVAGWRERGGIAAAEPMVQLMRDRQWVLDLEEHRRDPGLYGHVGMPAALTGFAEARMVVPLLEGAELLGFVVLHEPQAAFEPNFEDRDLLKTVGRHVATHVAQHEADRMLAEHRQFAAYHRLTAFVMHDLKNLAAQLALVVSNAERHRRNPEFVDDAIGTVANAVRRMERLIEQLHSPDEQGAVRKRSLAELAGLAVERASLRSPVPELQVASDLPVRVDAERFVTAVEHLLRNAQEATPPAGNVRVRVDVEGTNAVLSITDTGCGMSRDFVGQRLFAPFDSTKGTKGMGIGAYQAREYVRAAGGALVVHSAPGRGTTVEIRLAGAGE